MAGLGILLLIVLIVVAAIWGLQGLGTVLAIVLGIALGLVLLGVFAVWYLKRKVRRQMRQWGALFAQQARERRGRDDAIDVEGRPHDRQP